MIWFNKRKEYKPIVEIIKVISKVNKGDPDQYIKLFQLYKELSQLLGNVYYFDKYLEYRKKAFQYINGKE